MPKPASPYIRTTEVGGFVNSSWKEFWYRSIENQIADLRAQEAIEFSKTPRTADEWKAFLAGFSPLREAARIGWESTTYGKAVHAVVEAFLLGQTAPITLEVEAQDRKGKINHLITEREKFSANLIIEWCKQAKVKPLMVDGVPAIELALQDEVMMITGHPDLICTFGDDPRPWIVDWKTSKECRDEYGLQLAAYVLAFERKTGISINDGVIIRTPSDPNASPQFEAHEYHDLLTYHGEVFKHALDVVQYFKHKGRHKKVKIKKAA